MACGMGNWGPVIPQSVASRRVSFSLCMLFVFSMSQIIDLISTALLNLEFCSPK